MWVCVCSSQIWSFHTSILTPYSHPPSTKCVFSHAQSSIVWCRWSHISKAFLQQRSRCKVSVPCDTPGYEGLVSMRNLQCNLLVTVYLAHLRGPTRLLDGSVVTIPSHSIASLKYVEGKKHSSCGILTTSRPLPCAFFVGIGTRILWIECIIEWKRKKRKLTRKISPCLLHHPQSSLLPRNNLGTFKHPPSTLATSLGRPVARLYLRVPPHPIVWCLSLLLARPPIRLKCKDEVSLERFKHSRWRFELRIGRVIYR